MWAAQMSAMSSRIIGETRYYMDVVPKTADRNNGKSLAISDARERATGKQDDRASQSDP